MANVGDSAHTDHGLGIITEVDTVRGRASFRVAGRGFNVWVDEARLRVATETPDLYAPVRERTAAAPGEHYGWLNDPDLEHLASLEVTADNPWNAAYDLQSTVDPGNREVNDDNSTTLPYDPTPQFPVDMFRHEQTIIPGEQEIDRDERTSPSDSMSGDRRSENRPYPGPNPDLFAKDAAYHDDEPCGACGAEAGESCRPYCTGQAAHDDERHHHGYRTAADAENGFIPSSPANSHWRGVNAPTETEARVSDAVRNYQKHLDSSGGSPGRQNLMEFLTLHDDKLGQPERDALFNHVEDHLNDRHLGYRTADFEDEPSSADWGDDEWHKDLPDGPERTFDAGLSRPAGLSSRYAHIEPEINYGNPVVAFRQDPVGFLQALASRNASQVDYDALDARFGSLHQLEQADTMMRTAAWQDVREKAMRLRREGRVHIKSMSNDGTYASVEGDHGTYETIILKGAAMHGIGGGQSISDWYCGCAWGDWAFQRKVSYVGRLCSHAYATYLDMQSRYMKDNPQHFKPKRAASRTAAVVDEFKTWMDDNDLGPEPDSVADFLHTTGKDYTEEDVEKLYEYIHSHPAETKLREFDTDYTFDPDKVYKEAELLRNRPRRLSPSLQQVPKEWSEGEEWTDVTKDDRKTTGPDQIMRQGAREKLIEVRPEHDDDDPGDLVHFAAIARMLHADTDAEMSDTTTGAESESAVNAQVAPMTAVGSLVASLHRKTADGSGDSNFGPDKTGWREHQSSTSRMANGLTDWVNDMANSFDKGKSDYYHQKAVDFGISPPKTPNPPPAPSLLNHGPTIENYISPGPPGKQPPALAGESGPTAAPGVDGGINKGLPSAPGKAPAPSAAPAPSDGGWTENKTLDPIRGDSYKIQQGDTLNNISNRSGISVQDLAKNNSIADINKINAGDTIKLPGGGSRTPADGNAAQDGLNQAVPGVGGAALNTMGQPPTPPTNLNANPASSPSPPPPTPPAVPGLGAAAFKSGTDPNSGRTDMPVISPAQKQQDINAGMYDAMNNTPGLSPNRKPTARTRRPSWHYAADEESRPPIADAASDLDRLRGYADDEPDYHHMRERNHDISELVEDLEDAGVGASQFVAMLHYADVSYPTDPNRPPSNSVGPGGTPPPRDNPANPEQLPPPPNLQPGSISGIPPNVYGPPAETNPQIPGMIPHPSVPGMGLIPGFLQHAALEDLHYAALDEDWDAPDSLGNFTGHSNPNWADEPFAGSGPNPKNYISDSASYVDSHERPGFQDLTGDGDILKYNDSRSAPRQGPNKSARRRRHALDGTLGDAVGGSGATSPTLSEGTNANAGAGAAAPAGMGNGFGLGQDTNPASIGRAVTTNRHYYAADDDSGYFNPDNPDEDDWEKGSGDEFVRQVGDSASQIGQGMHGIPGSSGGAEEAGEGAGEASLAEEAAPMLLAAGYDDRPRRARRAGTGSRAQVRIDPGLRGRPMVRQTSTPPDNFGYDGESSLTEYGEPAADPGMNADIVASFQRSAGAQAVMGSSFAGGGGRYDDIASSAHAFLRTAGRKFSPEEQRELEQEEHHLGARNLPTQDDLAGTHYLL